MTTQPARIDWAYEALVPAAVPADVPELGAYPGAEAALVELVSRWGGRPGFPSTQRLAFGAVLNSPVASREDGYRELRPLIDAVPDPLNAYDFLYQINRPRPSRAGIDGLQINRLSKWAVQRWQMMIATSEQPPFSVAPRYHCALELDMSTPAEFQGPLSPARIPALIADLVEAGREVAERGEHL